MTDCIAPLDLEIQIKSGKKIVLVDVRTPSEFEEIHASIAVNHPLDRLDAKAIVAARGAAGLGEADPIHLICRAGPRAEEAARRLAAVGVGPLVLVQGGTTGWEQAGCSVTRGDRKVISLERQVRIVAGLLVLGGVLAGAFLDPRFYIISGFVGAGLVFAGVTDRCGMAILLGRMPWNQGRSCRC
jgi:rhodanese-related sulfurtransferase